MKRFGKVDMNSPVIISSYYLSIQDVNNVNNVKKTPNFISPVTGIYQLLTDAVFSMTIYIDNQTNEILNLMSGNECIDVFKIDNGNLSTSKRAYTIISDTGKYNISFDATYYTPDDEDENKNKNKLNAYYICCPTLTYA